MWSQDKLFHNRNSHDSSELFIVQKITLVSCWDLRLPLFFEKGKNKIICFIPTANHKYKSNRKFWAYRLRLPILENQANPFSFGAHLRQLRSFSSTLWQIRFAFSSITYKMRNIKFAKFHLQIWTNIEEFWGLIIIKHQLLNAWDLITNDLHPCVHLKTVFRRESDFASDIVTAVPCM